MSSLHKSLQGCLAIAAAGILLSNSCFAATLVMVHRLPAQVASDAARAAVISCAQQGFAVSASIVDSDNMLQAFLRGDGAAAHTVTVSADKAYTALEFGDTGILSERIKTAPINYVLQKEPHLVPQPGGLVIRAGKERIGSIGVSGAPGSDKDEACAKAGLDTISAQLKEVGPTPPR